MLPLKSMIIQKINPISWANLAALATTIFTVIVILLSLIFGAIGGFSMLEGAQGADTGKLLEVIGKGAIGVIITVIFVPLFFGALTWVYTVIFALIINLSLKLIGGLKIEVSE